MKKTLIKLIAGMLTLLMLVGCSSGTQPSNEGTVEANGESQEPIVMRLANANPESDARHQECEIFKKLVEEKTDGAVKIEIYSGAVLGDWRETIEGLKMGTCEIVVEGLNTVENYTQNACDVLPYLFRDYDHFMKFYYGDAGNAFLDQITSESGFKLFAPSYRGMRVVTSKKKFTNAEEVKGLKIRVPGTEIFVKTWQHLETQATPMALTETLTGIQQGTVEAQENPIIMSYNFGFYDVCDYLIRTNHVCGADAFIMDEDYFNSLSEDIQVAIVESAEEAAKEISQFNLENEEHYLDLFREKGVEVIEPDIASFEKKFEGFVEKEFPHLTDLANSIKSVQ